MKNFSLLILFIAFLSSCRINSYYTFDNHSSNILYVGVRNLVKIIPVNGRQLRVSVSAGSIESINDNQYIIYVDSIQKVNLLIQQGKKESEINFRVVKVPDLTIYFSCKNGIASGNNIPDSLFQGLNGVIPYPIESFNYDCTFEVVGFKITRIDRIGKRESWDLESRDLSAIPNSSTKLAKKAEKGDIYIFSNIKVKIGCTSEVRTIENKVVIIE